MIRMKTAFLAAGVCLLAAPAFAQSFDDRPSTFAPLVNLLGGGDENAKGDIDFRERAPIVVPKGGVAGELPAPRPGVGPKVANWPKDQDLARAREERAQARVPQQIEWNRNPALSKREMMDGRSDEQSVAVSLCDTYVNGVQDCAPTPMEKIKRVFSLSNKPDDRDVVVVGKEPTREYLTEPPRGYRNASQTTRATREATYERPDASDPRAYLREQEKRNSDYR